MSHHQHRAQAGGAPIEVHVLVVSSSRTEATDRSGALIAELLTAAGHRAASRAVVDDDLALIRQAVEALAEADAQAVVLTGGTGITGRDLTPEALAPLLSPRLDGFGEAFRWLSFQEIGPAAMLSRACAGLVGRTAVFAVPGSTAACRLAVERLIAPELGHLVHLARTDRERALPAAPAPAGDRVRVALSASASAGPETEAADAGWQRTVGSWGGVVHREIREPLPEGIERLAAATDLLRRAGESACLVLPDGRRYSLWGFPDLVRPSAKVLAIRAGGPIAEVLALHRWPTASGTCIDGGSGHTPSRGADPREVAEERTGRAPTGEMGPLFAVTGGAVHYERGQRVIRWDGTRERNDGTPSQALASLMLDWSQR